METEAKALKVFVVAYDGEDKDYREKFAKMFGEANVLTANYKETDLKDGEAFIADFRKSILSQTDVCFVLIGENTWKRKLVDWEICAAMRDDADVKRKGIIALILPTREDYQKGHFIRYTIPPRLYDNYPNGYVKIYNWKEDAGFFQRIAEKAVSRKDMLVPNLNRPLYSSNKSQAVKKWVK